MDSWLGLQYRHEFFPNQAVVGYSQDIIVTMAPLRFLSRIGSAVLSLKLAKTVDNIFLGSLHNTFWH